MSCYCGPPASIAGAPAIQQASHRLHARRSAFDHEVDRRLATKQKPAVFQSDPPIRQCFPKTDIESLEDADGKRDSRQDLLIEACAMGISLPSDIGWHIHCTEQAPRPFLGQLPFPGDVQEGLDRAGTEVLTFDGIFEVSVARLLEGAPFFAVLGRRIEKPRRLLIKVGLRISTGLRCWFLCHHLFTYRVPCVEF